MNKDRLRQFIKEMPKCDLHVHLGGSIRISTLIELAQKNNVILPSYTEAGLNELVFKDSYKDLLEYLKGFEYTSAVMQTPDNLERIAYEFAWDNINEGVCYVEVRFAPQLYVNKLMNIESVFKAVSKGMDKAQSEYNATDKVKNL